MPRCATGVALASAAIHAGAIVVLVLYSTTLDSQYHAVEYNTAVPTIAPTATPTSEPSAAPTTRAPTDAPTDAPTVVDSPSAEPSAAPSGTPSIAPTTRAPTLAPTNAPTSGGSPASEGSGGNGTPLSTSQAVLVGAVGMALVGLAVFFVVRQRRKSEADKRSDNEESVSLVHRRGEESVSEDPAPVSLPPRPPETPPPPPPPVSTTTTAVPTARDLRRVQSEYSARAKAAAGSGGDTRGNPESGSSRSSSNSDRGSGSEDEPGTPAASHRSRGPRETNASADDVEAAMVAIQVDKDTPRAHGRRRTDRRLRKHSRRRSRLYTDRRRPERRRVTAAASDGDGRSEG
jgi:hypothetical protein